ncbi:MAG: hypothetical protein KDJ15_02070, partial [Alphaproteobacteria bacterium]|nr:hypothetical protein [Alphaproteobacteria bacterium]
MSAAMQPADTDASTEVKPQEHQIGKHAEGIIYRLPEEIEIEESGLSGLFAYVRDKEAHNAPVLVVMELDEPERDEPELEAPFERMRLEDLAPGLSVEFKNALIITDLDGLRRGKLKAEKQQQPHEIEDYLIRHYPGPALHV